MKSMTLVVASIRYLFNWNKNTPPGIWLTVNFIALICWYDLRCDGVFKPIKLIVCGDIFLNINLDHMEKLYLISSSIQFL